DSTGTIAERVAASGVLRHPVGTPADGAVGLQSLVPLVRGAFARRPDLGSDHLHEEPRPTAEWQGVYQIHDPASEPSADQAAIVRRAFFGGRNADRGVGLPQEFPPKDGSGDEDGGANFHGQQRKNDTHAGTSDPDSRLYRKAAGREAKLCYLGHATRENRHGLAVAGTVTLANGIAERRASEMMLKAKAKEAGRRITVGEDKAYDTADHVANLRAVNVTPHVTQNDSITATGKRRQSANDG